MLFWKNLTTSLKSWGFQINPYDRCVSRKMVNRKKITIVWHVDDLKISHTNPKVVTEYIQNPDRKYGQDARGNNTPLTICRGKKHEYLCMLLDYSNPGKIKIDMIEYTEKILEDTKELFPCLAVTPAANHLFEVNEQAQNIECDKADLFHHLVAHSYSYPNKHNQICRQQ